MANYLSVLILCCCFCYITPLLATTSTSNILAEDNKDVITIDLSSYSYDASNKTTQVFLNYLHTSNDNCTNLNIDVVNAPSNGGFFVVQFHSFKANFNLSNEENEVVTGRDTGLVQVNLLQGFKYRYRLSCVQELESVTKILVAVVMYEKEDPVPGGCNLTFKPEISLYQNITYTNNVVQVDAQPASFSNSTCENSTVHLEMYHLYMREQTLDENEYFDSISKMLTADSIMNNAKSIPRPDGVLAGRRYYSAYVGTGTVYAVVAHYENRVAAYVPAVSYACNIDNWNENCVAPNTVMWKIIIAILLFLGTVALYAGHACFNFQVCIFGFILGFFTAYLIPGIINGQNVTVPIALGAVIGIAWFAIWCRYGIPIVSVSLPVFFIGYATCCIIFYSSISDSEIMRGDLNYWGIFLSVIIVTTIPLIAETKFSHIASCSFLGATAITVSANHYAGGNLHYVFLNNLRRATIPGFNKVVIDPVFQYTDVLLSMMWLILLGSGIAVQLKTNQGRAPFPPQPRVDIVKLIFIPYRVFRRRVRRNNENRPLITVINTPPYSHGTF